MAHQFPWSPAASVSVGLALRRRYQGHSGAPSLAAHRKQIIRVTFYNMLALATVGWHVYKFQLTPVVVHAVLGSWLTPLTSLYAGHTSLMRLSMYSEQAYHICMYTYTCC